MKLKNKIVSYYPTFTALLNYLEAVESEYMAYGVNYKYSIYLRVMFNDYKLVIRYDG